MAKRTFSGDGGSSESEQLHSGLKKMRIGEDERAKEFSVPNMLNAIEDVTNWKELGVQLKIKSSRLKEIEELTDVSQHKVKMITLWKDLDKDANWEKLQTALESPAMCENKVAKGIADRRGSSFDNKSVLSSQSNPVILEFNEASVRNAIVNIKSIRELGEHLNIPTGILNDIDKLPTEKQKLKLVEEWFKVDTECNWKTLDAAIRAVNISEFARMKAQSGSLSEDRMSSFSTSFEMQALNAEDPMEELTKTKNMALIKEDYITLKEKIVKNLMKVNPNMSDFRQHVIELFDAGNSIPSDGKIKDIFKALTEKKFWNFYDVSYLESIIKKFSQELEVENMALVSEYKKQLAGFRTATKIADYIKSNPEAQKLSEEYVSIKEEEGKYDERYRMKLSAKLKGKDKFGIKISLKSLEYVEKLWNSLCEEFDMPSLPKLLDSIVDGSIIIHWLILHTQARSILERIREAVGFFERNFIANIYLEKICIYDEESGVVHQKVLDYVKLLMASHEGVLEHSTLEEYFPDINAPVNEEGRTLLMLAAEHGHRVMLESLLDWGADAFLRDTDGEDVLSLSMPHSEDHNWIKNNVIGDKLIMAAKNDDLSMVERALKFGVDPNTKELDEYGWTALLWACENGHSKIVDCLLEHGADVDAEDTSNWTSLILASRNGFLDIVRVLLDKGADVNKKTNIHWSSLMWTARQGHIDVAKLLLERGADYTIQDKAGFSPLIQASQDGQLGIVEVLVEHDPSPDHLNQRTTNDWTALMTSIKNEHEDISEFLVKKGCDVHNATKDGVTALHVASYRGLNNTVRNLCLRKKVKVDEQDEDGITPLIFAAKQGNLAIVRTLVENGHADVNLPESENKWTAIFFAMESGHQNVLEYLLRSGRVKLKHEDTSKKTIVDLAKEINHTAFQYMLQCHTQETEAILSRRIREEAKPVDMNNYKSMLNRMEYKIAAKPGKEVSAGAA